jgi:hypothetical protein
MGAPSVVTPDRAVNREPHDPGAVEAGNDTSGPYVLK